MAVVLKRSVRATTDGVEFPQRDADSFCDFITKLYVSYVLTLFIIINIFMFTMFTKVPSQTAARSLKPNARPSAVKYDNVIHGRGVIRVKFKIGIVWQFRDLCPALTDNPYSRA